MPIPTRVVTVTEPVSALKVLLAAVKLFDTVADPVVVNVDTVVEPALIVPEVLILPPVTPPVAVIPVREEPSPINPVAVTVPITCSVVAGVVVPMPTLPDVVAMVAVPVIDIVDAVTEPVDVIVFAVIEPELPTTTPSSVLLSVTCNL